MVSHFKAAKWLAFAVLLFGCCEHSLLYAQSDEVARLPNYFQREIEFPNYFLSADYRHKSAEEIPPEILKASRDRLERAMQSVLKRMEVPILFPGKAKPELFRYLDFAISEARKIEADVKILPSGGLVRSAIGYIYQIVYDRIAQDPGLSAENVLEEIAKASDGIPGHEVRGRGSDLDILVSSRAHVEKEKIRLIQGTLKAAVDSAEAAYGARDFKGAYKRAIFTVGDVKDYREQTERSVRQGGADIDFLAFDIEAGHFVEPEGRTEIVNNLLRAEYQYLPPEKGQSIEDAEKQTVRGMRPLVELPFLRIKDERRFREELRQLQVSAEADQPLSRKAIDQFNKMTNNVRFGGGHNRIYRGAGGSLEKSVLEVLRTIEEKSGRFTLPEYVDSFSLAQKPDIPKDLSEILMPLKDFLRGQTEEGFLYHGTPQVDNSLAVMRAGFFVSKSKGHIPGRHSNANFGRGGYFSADRGDAVGYAKQEGVVFKMKVKPDSRLRILDFDRQLDSDILQQIKKSALEQGRDLFEVLARDFGIDFIVRRYRGEADSVVLLQNAAALEPITLPDLINAYAFLYQNDDNTPAARYTALENYRSLYGLGIALGMPGIVTPPSAQDFLETEFIQKFLQQDETALKNKKEILNLVRSEFSEDAVFARELTEKIKSNPLHAEALEVLMALDWGRSGNRKFLEDFTTNSEIPLALRWRVFTNYNLNFINPTAPSHEIHDAKPGILNDPGLPALLIEEIEKFNWRDGDMKFLNQSLYRLNVLDSKRMAEAFFAAALRKPDDIREFPTVLPGESHLQSLWPTEEAALRAFPKVIPSKTNLNKIYLEKVRASGTKNADILLSLYGRQDGEEVERMVSDLTEKDILQSASSHEASVRLGVLKLAAARKISDSNILKLAIETAYRYGSSDIEKKIYFDGFFDWASLEAKERLRGILNAPETDPDFYVRALHYRAKSFWIREEKDLPILFQSARDSDKANRWDFITLLNNIPKELFRSEAVIKEVESLLKDPHSEIVEAALTWLANHSPTSEAFQHALVTQASKFTNHDYAKILQIAFVPETRPPAPILQPDLMDFFMSQLTSEDVLIREVVSSVLAEQMDAVAADEKRRESLWKHITHPDCDTVQASIFSRALKRLYELMPEKTAGLQKDLLGYVRHSGNVGVLDAVRGEWAPETWKDLEDIYKTARDGNHKISAAAQLLLLYGRRPASSEEIDYALSILERAYEVKFSDDTLLRTEGLTMGLAKIHQLTEDKKLAKRLEDFFARTLKPRGVGKWTAIFKPHQPNLLESMAGIGYFSESTVPRSVETVKLLEQLALTKPQGADVVVAESAYRAIERAAGVSSKGDAVLKIQSPVRAAAQASLQRMGNKAPCLESLMKVSDRQRKIQELLSQGSKRKTS